MAHGGGGFEKLPWYKKIFLAWTHDAAHYISEKKISNWRFEPLVVMPVVFMVLLVVAGAVDRNAVSGTLAMVVALSPLWLPVFLAVILWVVWIHYIRFIFWFKQKHVLLEIQLPPEVTKSPLAMELFLGSMWHASGEGTFIARVWDGKFRPVFSIEIASNEGQVRFYLWCRESWKNVLEAKLYGQFPEARVSVVEDYAAKVPFNTRDYNMWGAEFAKTETNALPIKTYIDYGLDKNPDTPETQVDPISNLLEFMGQIGQGEYIWLQIIMKARKKDEWYALYDNKKDSWKDPAAQKIRDIMKGAVKRTASLIDDPEKAKEQEKQVAQANLQLSSFEKLQIEAIERSLSKLVYECGIRVMYLGKNENYNGINIGNVVRIFDPYKQNGFNQIMPVRGQSDFDYPWQDWNDIRQNKVKRNLFFRYKHRAYFYVPYDQVPTFMTTEELATIWHFPSSAVVTPALDRVPSKRSDAPINLPI